MKKWLWVLSVLLVFSIAMAISMWTDALPFLTGKQRTLLAFMRQNAAPNRPEANAFFDLLTIRHDVPRPKRAEVAMAYLAEIRDVTGDELPGKSAVLDRFEPRWFPGDDDPSLCGVREPGCLSKVRASIRKSRERMQRFEDILIAARDLRQFDHYWDLSPARIDFPVSLPRPSFHGLVVTDAALLFVDGQHDAALADVCNDARWWRRVRIGTNSLIFDALAGSYIADDARLFAEMLSELDVTTTLPPACIGTFDPISDAELDLCNAARREFAMLEAVFDDAHAGRLDSKRSQRPWVSLATGRLSVSRDHAAALSAPAYARLCFDVSRTAHERRIPDLGPPHQVECGIVERVFDPIGCRFAEQALPQMDDYFYRLLDLDARMKLVSTALWLRRTGAMDGALLSERPEALRTSFHPMEWVPERHAIRARNQFTKWGDWWEIPIHAQSGQPTSR